MEDVDDLDGLVHRSLDEAPAGLEELIASHKSAVERFDLLGWPRPQVALVSGSGLAVDLGETSHGPVQLEFLLPFPSQAIAGHPHQEEMLYKLKGQIGSTMGRRG